MSLFNFTSYLCQLYDDLIVTSFKNIKCTKSIVCELKLNFPKFCVLYDRKLHFAIFSIILPNNKEYGRNYILQYISLYGLKRKHNVRYLNKNTKRG